MEPVNFAYWLQSLFEVAKMKSFTAQETLIIKRHAELVLKTIEINTKKRKSLNPALLPPVNSPFSDRRFKC